MGNVQVLVVVDTNRPYRASLVEALRVACQTKKNSEPGFQVPEIRGCDFIDEVGASSESRKIVGVSTGLMLGPNQYGGKDMVKKLMDAFPVCVHSHLGLAQVLKAFPDFPEEGIIQKNGTGVPEAWTDAMLKTIKP
jgi:hypothetical protein